jgi:toxin ParE1/3/4
MDFRVEITGPAIADLAEIVSYIAQENPAAAKALGENLLDAALSLAKTPFKGSRYQMLADVRKLTLPPFKIFYRVNDRTKAVQILRFWHSARREPKLGPGVG